MSVELAPEREIAPRCWTAAQLRSSTRWHFTAGDDVLRDAVDLVAWSDLPAVAHDPVALLRADSVITPAIARLATAV